MVSPPVPGGTLDVAVVGGGVAGLYAAWRLAVARPGLRIAVFEAGAAVGGRLRTFRFDALPELPLDLGGMSFSRSHAHVVAAADALQLPLREVGGGRNDGVLFLRGRALRRRSIRKHGFGPLFPFGLSRREQARGQIATLREAAERLVPDAMRLTRADWQTLHDDGHPLRERPCRAALAEVLGFEAVRYVEGRAGVSLFTRAPSALHALEWFVESCRMAAPMLTPVGGFQQLPLALADAAARHGCMVFTESHVVALSLGVDGAPHRLRLQHARDGGNSEVAAAKVILALPRRAIERLEILGADNATRSRLQSLLRSAEPHPLGKLLLHYRGAWWTPLGVDVGFSATDMPLGQIWFFPRGAADRDHSVVSAGGVAMLMFDGSGLDYWRSLLPVPMPEDGFVALGADSAPVREAHRQMQLMFGPLLGRSLPEPSAACLEDWGCDRFGGAVHLWGRGVDAQASAAAMLRPDERLDLFVCGEAWSHRQGWVEGALERADTLLERWFGMERLPASSG